MSMEQALEKIKTAGLAGIIFTDHQDINTPSGDKRFMFDPAIQQQKIDQMKEQYDIPILKGIEIGLQPHTIEDAAAFVNGYRFDTIIASVHFVDGIDPYHDHYYDIRDIKMAYGRYLETIYYCITKFANFDVLGHYDYITRYAPYRERVILYSRFKDILDQILTFLAREGKALEINTNTYREKNGATPYLDVNVLKRFKEVGGEIVTLGSDAHDSWRIGEKFVQYSEIIKDCGFRYIAHFQNREAQFTSI